MNPPALIPTRLPALVERAASQLAEARSAAEVLDARDTARAAYDAAKSAVRIAKAKGAYDDIIVAVYRAQANALDIEAAAKRRLAEEYDAAQERGEVKANGGARNFSVPDQNSEIPSAADIGLSRKDIHEARQLRDAEMADPGVTRRTLNRMVSEGQEPTKAALRREIAPRPVIDLQGRNPRDFNQAMHFESMVKEYLRDLSGWNLSDLLPRLIEGERESLRKLLRDIGAIHETILTEI